MNLCDSLPSSPYTLLSFRLEPEDEESTSSRSLHTAWKHVPTQCNWTDIQDIQEHIRRQRSRGLAAGPKPTGFFLLLDCQGASWIIKPHSRLGQVPHWHSAHSQCHFQGSPALSAALISLCEKQPGCPTLLQPDKWQKSQSRAPWQRLRAQCRHEGWRRRCFHVKCPDLQMRKHGARKVGRRSTDHGEDPGHAVKTEPSHAVWALDRLWGCRDNSFYSLSLSIQRGW